MSVVSGKLGTGDVFVYDGGNLTIGTSHLNNSSLNIEGGSVALGTPLQDENGNLLAYTLLQTATENHSGNAVIRLGAGGSGGTLDLTGSWANGHYELYSGTLMSSGTEGHISGKIDIDIAAGDTLEIKDIIFTRDLSAVEQHTHSATIASGGQLLLTGSTDIRLHTLDVTLEKPQDGEVCVVPVVFEAYTSGDEKANLDVQALNITLDEETLEDLIADSADGDGESKYQIVSVSNAPDTDKISDYITTNFTTVTINGGSIWNARINDQGQLILLSEIPEPATFALMTGLVFVAFAGTRRRRCTRNFGR